MLAKNLNDNACVLNELGACEFFASKLAPTKSLQQAPSHIRNFTRRYFGARAQNPRATPRPARKFFLVI
ncbi:hypothetical protein C1Y26_14315 [Pseudomonas sp. MPR-R2A7]|nr:hypothetical protein C1Y23_20240 [Pseudomonas sp. GW460-12]PMX31646.1 hypothetical protein C1Y24_24110 [Pseudomonas sp. MPR-R2A4]PMX40546.1 hypothetical protein C1Y26_14315 [Pseudomonas sp. MPR-R2A7]PMX50569.1 hypothetical protein C1Y17_25780 [Pseudomonas sp. MPR-R2A6]PMX85795.1 hypothetical protein C1Y21_25670 [Pseudomonas sp. MPR-R2A3]PMY12424.1 hypothetical protein C1Y22_16275 [Pseudomonas sp. MPR-R2A5]PNA29211.1 hypothetical protein C1Y16_24505 [Pseudomonas sp. MPR-ANB1]PNA42070.1 hyp